MSEGEIKEVKMYSDFKSPYAFLAFDPAFALEDKYNIRLRWKPFQLRLKGKGEAGPAGHGDALVTITIEPHSFFRREGDDVRLDLPITLDEAVAGAKVKVPTVEGPVMLTVAPGSGSGKVLRLKGRGFTRKGGGRGDQLVTLEIDLPEDVSELAGKLDGWRDPRNVRARLGV